VAAGEQQKQRSSSRYRGVSWHKATSSWQVRLWDPQTKRSRSNTFFASEDDAARAYDCAAVQAHGPDAKRNFPGEAISELPLTVGEERKQRSSSRYHGVCWHKARSSWRVQITDPQTKRQKHIGCFASEEDAARAYDCAAVQAHGPGAKRNFPGEDISELPETVGDKQKQRSSSGYIGVSWNTANLSWRVQLTDPQTKRSRKIGCYASEEDAARAYDFAAVQAHGPGAERNFLGEAISEAPETVGEKRKQLRDPQTKRSRSDSCFASEEDAARAYDCAAVQARGPGAERNFPGEAIRHQSSVAVGGQQRKLRGSSRYHGVCWHKARSAWRVELTDPQTKNKKGARHIGYFATEEDAARAYDFAAVQARGPGAERNFPGETMSRLPVTAGEEWKQLRDPQTKRSRPNTCYASEEDAARAYDRAAVRAHGPGAERTFPGGTISEPSAAAGEGWKQKSSRYLGVGWHAGSSTWHTYVHDPETELVRHIGSYASEEDAARAYDRAVHAYGPDAQRNFPDGARASAALQGVSRHGGRIAIADPVIAAKPVRFTMIAAPIIAGAVIAKPVICIWPLASLGHPLPSTLAPLFGHHDNE
jgi:hypothetical protein